MAPLSGDHGFIRTRVLHSRRSGPVWRNWQTQTTQNRSPQGVWVRVPPPAPFLDGFGTGEHVQQCLVRYFMSDVQMPAHQGTSIRAS